MINEINKFLPDTGIKNSVSTFSNKPDTNYSPIFNYDSNNVPSLYNITLEDINEPEQYSTSLMNTKNTNGNKDGKIDGTKQGQIGDCWLLSAVNALSYTEQGREVIKNLLNYKSDSTTVHLAVGDYEISNKELEEARAKGIYSSGDDDMLIIELAVEKFMNDIKNGNKVVTGDNSDGTLNRLKNVALGKAEQKTSVLDGGTIDEGIFLLTGKMGTEDYEYDTNGNYVDNGISSKEKQWLDDFQKDGNQNVILTASMYDKNGSDVATKDVNGKDVTIYSQHAYSIKSVDDKTVTVINPWDSSEEIVLSKETFYNTFSDVSKTDLSNTKDTSGSIVNRNEIVPDGLNISNEELYKLAGMPEKDRENEILYLKYITAYYKLSSDKEDLKKFEEVPFGTDSNDEKTVKSLIGNPLIRSKLSAADINHLMQIPNKEWNTAIKYLIEDMGFKKENIYNMLKF